MKRLRDWLRRLRSPGIPDTELAKRANEQAIRQVFWKSGELTIQLKELESTADAIRHRRKEG